MDQRKEYKGRYELIEVMDESDDEGQYNRSRYGSLHICGVIGSVDLRSGTGLHPQQRSSIRQASMSS